MMKNVVYILSVLFSIVNGSLYAQKNRQLVYDVEMSANVASGDNAPIWFTANRNGLSSRKPNSSYLKAGMKYNQSFQNDWKIASGLELAGVYNHERNVFVQQAYVDVSWRCLNLSVGIKERSPLGKTPYLTSGGMVEGNNAAPIPQIRAEIADYYTVPGTKGWFAFKGYIAYGRFMDDCWQHEFVQPFKTPYVEDILYHSKALTLKVGNVEKFPFEFEIGMLMSAQFGGKRHYWQNGVEKTHVMPHKLKNYAKVFLARAGGSDTTGGDQVNVEGNHLGSWNVGFNYHFDTWKLRVYYEHLFDDHSQMFFEYGRWVDGHIGIEVTLPKNRWVSTLLWEGLCTKQQTGPILYDGDGRFENAAYQGVQISAMDNYYNNFYYQSWQYYGMAIGNPLLPGPIYNNNGQLLFRSNRVRANHWAFCGEPTDEWSYRVLMSYALHWGTYSNPLDKVSNQFSSLYEVAYKPSKLKGWNFILGMGADFGDYIGRSTGGMITIRKEGLCIKK